MGALTELLEDGNGEPSSELQPRLFNASQTPFAQGWNSCQVGFFCRLTSKVFSSWQGAFLCGRSCFSPWAVSPQSCCDFPREMPAVSSVATGHKGKFWLSLKEMTATRVHSPGESLSVRSSLSSPFINRGGEAAWSSVEMIPAWVPANHKAWNFHKNRRTRAGESFVCRAAQIYRESTVRLLVWPWLGPCLVLPGCPKCSDRALLGTAWARQEQLGVRSFSGFRWSGWRCYLLTQ